MDTTPHTYQVRLQGQLDARSAEWFDGFTVDSDTAGTTTLTGLVADQAALHGLLRRLEAVGATLLSVNELHSESHSDLRRKDTP